MKKPAIATVCTLVSCRSGQARDTGNAVESRIETQDALDSVVLHDGDMQGIAGGESAISQDDFLRALCGGLIDSQNLVDSAEQSVECRLDGITAVNCNVAVQDFLQYLGVRHQALTVTHELLEESLRVSLVKVRRAHKIHRDVRIDQNHEPAPVYPRSICVNISSTSAVG